MTAPARLASIQRLAEDLAAAVRAFADEQTLSEHIRDRGEWAGLELDARRLAKAVEGMAERERTREPDLFEGARA